MGRYLAGRVRPSTWWNGEFEIIALSLPSSLPSSLFTLFLSIFLVLFPLILSFSFPIPLSSLSFSLLPTLFTALFSLARSFEQRASRSPVGHTPVRVKVSSVLPRIPPSFPLFIKPPPSTATTFRDTSNDTSCPSFTTAKFLDSSRRVASVLQRDDFFLRISSFCETRNGLARGKLGV